MWITQVAAASSIATVSQTSLSHSYTFRSSGKCRWVCNSWRFEGTQCYGNVGKHKPTSHVCIRYLLEPTRKAITRDIRFYPLWHTYVNCLRVSTGFAQLTVELWCNSSLLRHDDLSLGEQFPTGHPYPEDDGARSFETSGTTRPWHAVICYQNNCKVSFCLCAFACGQTYLRCTA
jgi:hypothetical protein